MYKRKISQTTPCGGKGKALKTDLVDDSPIGTIGCGFLDLSIFQWDSNRMII
jgi:hypothetical protein